MDKKKKTSKTATGAETSKKSSPGKSGKKDFLVVGLGASAGGVKALQDFFSTMPPNSGMAFVVILHLSPEHESNLKEIIEAQTNMQVSVVNETQKVEPNRVYVIPPNHQLEMVDGVIRPTAPSGERGSRVAVDVFFRTLAEAYHERSVCIVLSGTGTDGTLGLKAVKEANGFAIVQQPEDAEYDSMPLSAIGTQLADWILSVREMPEKLIQFRDSSQRLHLTDENADGKVAREIQADESLREILTVLRVRTGHDFSNYKTPTLVRRIARHLQIHDLEDIPAYLEFLRENPDEIHSLLKNLLINVTNFFRDPEAWTALEHRVVPGIFANKRAGDTIRVWSCGCASGEEAYSLAMILAEYAYSLPDPPKIQVFATDVDDDAIAEAREHRYPQSIEADVSAERLKRFFVKEGKYYRIKKELREMVLFAPHNVLRDPPFSKLDLVSCRNLLIYLNRDTQERIMEIFHFAISANGFLFLGSSETAEAVPHLFATVDKKLRIYSRRPASLSNQPPAPQMPVVGRWEVKIPEIRVGTKDRRPFSLGEVHYRLLEQYSPASVLVTQDFDIQYLSESASRFLRLRGGEPSSNLLKLINPDLLPDLRAALFTAQREHRIAEFPNIRCVLNDQEVEVNIIVRPVEIENETSDYLLIIFDDDRKIVVAPEDEKKKPKRSAVRDDAMETVVLRLEEELARTKENLRATIEQHEVSVEELKASNEELQAINEELRSTTEELETSKEELQSVNEELTTVNHELKEKMDETSRTNSDLQNLMASTDIATIFLDREFRIKRFTTPIEHLFNVTAADVGRPLEHFTHRLDYPNLARDAAEVLRKLTPIEREIRDVEKRVYLTRFVPYRTVDDRIEGVVLNFVDITERKAAEVLVEEDLRDTQILRELAAQSIADGDIQTLYDMILDAAIALTHADAGTFQLYDEKTKELVMLTTKNIPPEMAEFFARMDADSKTSCGIALVTGERAFVDFDSKKTKDKDGSARMHLAAGLLSAQSTPLVSRSGKPIGMFSTHWHAHHRPTKRELRFIDLLARQAADLIEQRQSEAELRESRANLALDLDAAKQLQKISSLLIEEGDNEALYERILDAGIAIMGADFGSIQRLDAERRELKLLAWRNFHPDAAEFWQTVSVETGSVCGAALQHGERVIVPDVNAQDSLIAHENLPYYHMSGIVAIQTTPLTTREGRVIGMISTHWRETHTPAERELRLLDILARQTADFFERARTENALRASEEKYRTLFDSIDEGLAVIELIFGDDGSIADFVLREVNNSYSRLSGLVNVVGKRGSEVFPHLENYWFETYERIYRTGEPERSESYNTDSNRWYQSYFSRIGAAGSPLIAVVFDDVTERKQREQQQDFLLKLADTLRPLSDPNEIETAACRLLGEQLGAHRVYYVEIFDSEGAARVRKQYLRDDAASIAGEYTIEAFEWTAAPLRRGEPVVVSDVYHSNLVPPEYIPAMEAVQQISIVLVPLIKEGKWVGVLTVGDDAPRDWKETEVELARETLERMWAAAERARVEEALRKSEEKYRTLFESMDEGFCTIEVLFDERGKAHDYRFLEANRAFERQTGIENGIGRTVREFAPDHEQFWFETYGRIAQTGRPERFEHEAAALGRYFDVYAFRIGEAGENRVAVIFKDIMERKRVQDALRESEERMRIAIEAAEMATWVWDLERNLVYWNEHHFRLFGMRARKNPVSPDEFFRRIHPNDRDRIDRELRKAIDTRTVFDSEFCIIRKDGGTRWMSGYGQITQISADGRALKMSGVMYDISTRKVAEESLRKSEEHLNLILESTKDYAIITFDLKGRITRWNAGAERIFGYTEKEAVGHSTHLIFTPEDIAAKVPEKELVTTLKSGRAEDERWHLRKDGSRFYASGVMQLLRDGVLEGFVKICRDQTARLEAEQSALEKEMLRRLVSAQEDERRRIARDIHDQFGQQITALRLKLDAIKKAAAENPEIGEQALDAEKTAAALDANVDFIAWELRPAALDDLGLRAALANFVGEWSNHSGIRAEFHASGLGRTRLAYEIETNLYRIAQEALNNVLKHAGANHVSILLEKSRSKVSLIIEDDGIGFNPKDKATRKKGIGLVGMTERAKICGGELEIESAKGKGTTVFARIPVKKGMKDEG